MNDRENTHRQRIVDQFTLQAVAFAQMPTEPNRFVLEAAAVQSDDLVLDVACGPGVLACAFAEVARKVVGIDLTPAMIEKARELQSSKGLANVTWYVGDV